MPEEIKDSLGVPGEVVEIRIETMDVKDAARELKKLVDRYASKGNTKLSEIPIGNDRNRIIALFNALKDYKDSNIKV